MSALIGILLDVSYSMKKSVGGPVDQQGGSWARSIFRVVDQLIKHDVSRDNKVFALCYGASREPGVFDLLNSIERTSTYSGCQHRGSKSGMLNEIVTILERNGAPYIRDWASMDMLENSISDRKAQLFLTMLNKNPGNFRRKFVRDCLPVECRERGSSIGATLAENRNMLWFIPVAGWLAHGYIGYKAGTATEESIKEAIDKGMTLIRELALVNVCSDAVVSVHSASEILHGCTDEESLTEEQVDKLMRDVEPFIYGGTPMISSLREAKTLMSLREYEHHKKVLFVLSDGKPMATDEGPPPDLSDLDVHVVSCYITESKISDPKRLNSSNCGNWYGGAAFMFDLSSSVRTQLLPRTIFKSKWKVDIDENETKLFFQVNHPDLINDVCAFARDVVCSQDTLCDLLTSIRLDHYINQENDHFKAKKQEDETCYANATATVLHLAMKRIVGRDGGYPDFGVLRDEIIAEYGKRGANTMKVLQEVCPKYRLQCQKLDDVKGALQAVTAKRSVIARFRLTLLEWESFENFCGPKGAGILSNKDLDITKRPAGSYKYGHAVVLTSFNSNGLTLMNSKGIEWGNNGVFSVENADVLRLEFVDVYWTNNDLLPSENEAYELEGPRISRELMTSLNGLKDAKYKCPLCGKESMVSDFTGRLVETTCPECNGVFDTEMEDAHDLVLNMYLTSLNLSVPEADEPMYTITGVTFLLLNIYLTSLVTETEADEPMYTLTGVIFLLLNIYLTSLVTETEADDPMYTLTGVIFLLLNIYLTSLVTED